MAIVKTISSLLAIQQIAAGAVTKSSELDLTSALVATLMFHLGRDDTGGALTSGVIFRVQAAGASSGNREWYDLFTFTSNVTVPEPEALTGTLNAGATVLTLASTTNLAIEQLILIKNSTIGNSEFARIVALSTNTSITVLDGITGAQTGSTIYNQAQEWVVQIDCTSITRLRIVVDNAANARTVVAEAFAITGV